MLQVAAIPVIAHITTVSQKGPVMEINPCLTASLVPAVAAAIGIEPSPASLVKSPLDIPVRIPSITARPAIPPATA